MAKTNKEFRSDLAKEMRDKRKERDQQLEQIEKSPFSEGVKESMRKEIKEIFGREIDEMKNRQGYEEAKKTHIAERKAKYSLDAAKERRNRLWQEKERLERELRNADDDVVYRGKEYNESQINHVGELENDSFAPQEIEENRIKGRESLYLYGNENWHNHNAKKVTMMEAMDKILMKRETEYVGEHGIRLSNSVEFRLGNKKYKILLPDSQLYTNGGITFSDISEVKNESVKKYLKKRSENDFIYLKKNK